MATYPHERYDDPLAQESAPSLSFRDAAIGTTYKGTIVARPKLVQSRNFETGLPETWPDGNPVMSVVLLIEVQGELRSVWAKKPSSMFRALVTAQKDAGGTPMEEGGTLYVRFEAEEPSKNSKFNAQKIYRCKYEPPVANTDPFAAEFAPEPQAAPAPAQAPQAAPAPAAKASGWKTRSRRPPPRKVGNSWGRGIASPGRQRGGDTPTASQNPQTHRRNNP